jgi:hypothetical protein
MQKIVFVTTIFGGFSVCEEFLHTFTIKICIHKKKSWKWNYYVVIV